MGASDVEVQPYLRTLSFEIMLLTLGCVFIYLSVYITFFTTRLHTCAVLFIYHNVVQATKRRQAAIRLLEDGYIAIDR